jgi:hypothetical protein
MTAGFERAVECRASGAIARLVKRVDLRVRFASAFVRAVPDDDAFVGDDRCADDRVRSGATDSAARLLERAAHPTQVLIDYHFSWKSAST